ncbi:MAG: HAMP domain-containing histidine kinase [Actinomycetota bacterium]|nr:HAMP domain-containing histidine kinase [Actinomycetota bacterium]
MTLRNRMGAVAAAAVAVTVIAVAITVYVAVRSELRGQVDTALAERAQPFLMGRGGLDRHDGDRGPGGAGPGGPGAPDHVDGGPGRPPASPRVPFGGPSGQLQLVAPGGRVSTPTDVTTKLPTSAQVKAIAARGTGRDLSDTHVNHTHLRVLTMGIGPRGAVSVARPLSEVDSVLRNLLLVLVLVGAAGIAVAAGLGILVARTALAPIARFTRRTETLAANPDVAQRLEVSGKDELARLARSFNTTLDALERAVEAQRQLVADASHELRTPIASLRANIQVLEDAEHLPDADRESLRADIISELDELTALVGDVIELARGAKPTGAADDVRLDEIAEMLVDRARTRSSALTFEVDLEPTLVTGEPDRINRAVSNLLDNARKWSRPGGTVEVELADGVLCVRDHGPGFAERDLPHVFDRFYRAENARQMPGSGLGLAIVRQTAESHGGFVKAANADGGGALLRVSFGAASPVSDGQPDAVAGTAAGSL